MGGVLPIVEVGSDLPYAIFQHAGTGLYGRNRRKITPRNGRFLVFRGRDGSMVFAKSVRGVRPTRYLKKALTASFRR